mmetsp:Transcript_50948/g.119049  ORF Transcript_50948/g.119049 Transcript_50948/m.119049 type:complete len:202 (+) Transcript_50948:628-1233(+)
MAMLAPTFIGASSAKLAKKSLIRIRRKRVFVLNTATYSLSSWNKEDDLSDLCSLCFQSRVSGKKATVTTKVTKEVQKMTTHTLQKSVISMSCNPTPSPLTVTVINIMSKLDTVKMDCESAPGRFAKSLFTIAPMRSKGKAPCKPCAMTKNVRAHGLHIAAKTNSNIERLMDSVPRIIAGLLPEVSAVPATASSATRRQRCS